ncbi:MAG: hypothetical protein ACK5CA_02495 [Cyanobacteriota bacterium]|jgi:hypothetical protein
MGIELKVWRPKKADLLQDGIRPTRSIELISAKLAAPDPKKAMRSNRGQAPAHPQNDSLG